MMVFKQSLPKFTRPMLYKGGAFILLQMAIFLLLQIGFFYLQNIQNVKNRVTIIKILDSQKGDLSVIEKYAPLDTIHCLKVQTTSEGRSLFWSQKAKGRCVESFLKLNGRANVLSLLSPDGTSYQISFLSKNSSFFFACLWLARGLLFLLSLSFFFLFRLKSHFKAIQKNFNEAQEIESVTAKFAHDIKSPIDLLKSVSTLEEDPENRAIIQQLTQQIYNVSRDFLFKRREIKNKKGPPAVCYYQTPVAKAICDVVHEKRRYFESLKDLVITYSFPSHDPHFLLTANIKECELKAILSHLINNAVEALKSGVEGKVGVSLEAPLNSPFLNIVVQDNGRGIPPELLGRLGNEEGLSFGKEHSLRSGNGLGLYNMKKSLLEVRGDCIIESTLGEGSRIVISLPKSTPNSSSSLSYSSPLELKVARG